MKKTLLYFLLIPVFGFSQNLFNYGFNGDTAALTAAGWVRTNQSGQASTTLWTVASYTQVTVSSTVNPTPFQNQVYNIGEVCPIPNGQDGTPNTFALVNFSSTTNTSTNGATISNWLITPEITVQNGDIVSFYTRKGTSGTTDYPDRLELRMSPNNSPALPNNANSVGGFTTLGVSVNPNLLGGFVYPKVWTQYSYVVDGLSGPTAVKFAFRYFVTNGGSNATNSDIIGIDTFSVDRPLSSDTFFKNNFSIYPNPVNNVLNISLKNEMTINSLSITDLNGRVVVSINSSSTSIDVSNLSSGVYFVSIETNEGKGTSKFVKN
ncbi:T9SS-dependent choice-of-anchor J family protein [Flavobacterium sp.]|uniref:T9SS-dependent choice-of-anchor J family protein n=1 Tax=Flavobacterium sp. TaxID=239 RepID=UPI002FDF067E